MIEVEDKCGGMGEEASARLFEPYVKRHQGNPSGSALGLSIAKRAVQAMRGTLNVTGHPGLRVQRGVPAPAGLSAKLGAS